VCHCTNVSVCCVLASFIVQLGVSIEVADAKGCTPLIVASQYGRTMLVGFLIGKGASLSVADREGDTALHWAAFKGDHMSAYV